jgi:hypothetical protein
LYLTLGCCVIYSLQVRYVDVDTVLPVKL